MKGVAPEIIPGRPPISEVMTFINQVAWSALAGLTPAIRAAVTDSGICVMATAMEIVGEKMC